MIIAGTGHRPDKLDCCGLDGYMTAARIHLESFAETIVRELSPDTVVSRMALGWDQALGWAAVRSGKRLVAIIPFEGQERLWSTDERERYQQLRFYADEVQVCCPGGYAPSKMQFGNEKMVRRLVSPEDRLVELWNGSDGGTANCHRYALEQIGAHRIVNVWERWVEYQREVAHG